jgi:type VI secretion system protein VasG
MVRDEAKAVLALGDRLRARIRGQCQAIEVLDAGIRVAKAGAQNPDAPLGVFLLVGPSGVGKTETALSIAELLFGGEQFMTSLNMSEFQEEHTVSRLIGSPPGYVGYGEGGLLTEAVRQRPYSVVLLDEVEKAKLAVMNLFYQVFDKGVLSDGEGREVDFKNTIILLTSNLATDVITEMGMRSEPPPLDVMVDAIRPVLSSHFQPALLARMQIVPFYPIKPEAMAEIVELKLRRFARQLEASQRIRLSWQPGVQEQIARRCTEVETGARNIDHILNRHVRPGVSTEILRMMNQRSRTSAIEVGVGADGAFTCRSA